MHCPAISMVPGQSVVYLRHKQPGHVWGQWLRDGEAGEPSEECRSVRREFREAQLLGHIGRQWHERLVDWRPEMFQLRYHGIWRLTDVRVEYLGRFKCGGGLNFLANEEVRLPILPNFRQTAHLDWRSSEKRLWWKSRVSAGTPLRDSRPNCSNAACQHADQGLILFFSNAQRPACSNGIQTCRRKGAIDWNEGYGELFISYREVHDAVYRLQSKPCPCYHRHQSESRAHELRSGGRPT